MLAQFKGLFSNDIGIDLGTANVADIDERIGGTQVDSKIASHKGLSENRLASTVERN